jgi:FKBP12-rapamycin complex-associated protein
LGGENEELLSYISSVFYQYNLKIFVQMLPLFLSRLGNKNIKILEKLILVLVDICIKFPFESLIPLIINKYSSSNKRKSISNQILYLVEKREPKLKAIIDNYKIFVNELNKCSLLLHEKWKEAIEEAAKMLVSKKYNNLVNQLQKVHKLMNGSPDNLYEINFNQCYYNELIEAEKYLKKYIIKPNDRYIKEAWVIYQNVYNNIQSKYKNMSTIYLEYISPLLSNIPENQIGLPGYFLLDKLYKERKQLIIGKTHDNCFEDKDKLVFLKKLDKYLYVLNTKQRPRKISLIGSDNKEYKYLLKSREDLRQDERMIQVTI